MNFRTEIDLPSYPFRIGHRSPTLLLGSCFTEHVGRMLERYLFPVSVNPFGVTYNPLSVKKVLEVLMQKKQYTKSDLSRYNDLWFSFDHYTLFSSTDPGVTLQKINRACKDAGTIFSGAQFLLLTWGTAWLYRYMATGQVVSNCHKIPADRFTRERLSAREIIVAYEKLLPRLFDAHPELKIIYTISPIRHWKDGAHGNQLSKSALLLAGDALQHQFPGHFFYFPSYELVMDELRDYRFYAGDMLHISTLATDFIWERFSRSLLSDESRKIIRQMEPLLKMLEHRPMIKEGEAHTKLIRKREDKLMDLKQKYPDLPWEKLS